MPLRSLRSSVLVWPTRDAVDAALRAQAAEWARTDPTLVCVDNFGSYARGNWGVGSDLDILIVVSTSRHSRDRRSLAWDSTTLPVPADVLVYTTAEWRELISSNRRFGRMLATEVVWVYTRTDQEPVA